MSEAETADRALHHGERREASWGSHTMRRTRAYRALRHIGLPFAVAIAVGALGGVGQAQPKKADSCAPGHFDNAAGKCVCPAGQEPSSFFGRATCARVMTNPCAPGMPGPGGCLCPTGYVSTTSGAKGVSCAIAAANPSPGNSSAASCAGMGCAETYFDAFQRSHGLVPAEPIGHVEQVALGPETTCARISDGTVKCWGTNDHGQVGDGTLDERHFPTVVAGVAHATQVVVGGYHACALLTDAIVKCWGNNQAGQLGDGTTTLRPTPATVTGLSQVAQLTAGDGHTCALLKSGAVKCWGFNSAGQIGNGTTANALTPTLVPRLANVRQVVAGGIHTCARLADGTARCWGGNSSGQLGDGNRDGFAAPSVHSAPVVVLGLSSVVELSLGSGQSDSSCARLVDGSVNCWGMNGGGQLGDGTTTDRPTPTPVVGVTAASSISAGPGHGCARLTDGTVTCWGVNLFGQLGDGTTANHPTAAVVTGLAGVAAIAVGTGHSCAVKADGTLWCWGGNVTGQLGTVTRDVCTVQVDVATANAVACALRPALVQ